MNAQSARRAKLPHLLDGPAQYERGADHLLGRGGVQPNLGIAVSCFLNAAACKDARGLYSAGMMYLRGIGVMANRQLASGLLQGAASQQHPAACRVLEALRRGGDVAVFPIVPLDTVPPTTPWAAGSRLWGRAWHLLRRQRAQVAARRVLDTGRPSPDTTAQH
ncbi:MAG: hypothetical protein JWP22_2178 [Ramlibacter sp.]|jgi:hypothetical protein|nr:hypothetical protein [Ramlibacter sp.]MDB5913503.1 hypothetical protein [Ramlibacter sp.]